MSRTEKMRSQIMAGEELIPAQRVSEIIGISTKHMRDLERDGAFIPRVVVGPRRIMYKRSDLVAWIEARTIRLNEETEVSS